MISGTLHMINRTASADKSLMQGFIRRRYGPIANTKGIMNVAAQGSTTEKNNQLQEKKRKSTKIVLVESQQDSAGNAYLRL